MSSPTPVTVIIPGMDMRIVDQIETHPGCCPITGKNEGPFVETEMVIVYGSGVRFTPTVALARQLGEAAGMIPSEDFTQAMRLVEEELDELKEWKAAAELDLEDYNALRGAMQKILRGGVTVNKSGAVTLTPWPGGRKPRDLDEPTAMERLEAEDAEV